MDLKSNKRSYIGKNLMAIIRTTFLIIERPLWITILIFFLLFSRFGRADTINSNFSVVININSTNILVNVNNTVYNFNFTSNANITINHTFPVSFNSNFSNVTAITNVTCSNSSISLSCSCPSMQSCVVSNVSCEGIDLLNSTKQDLSQRIFNKIDEGYNSAANNIVFQLQPTKAALDDCRTAQFNASVKQQDAEKQRDKFAADNLALGVSLEGVRSDKSRQQAVFFAFIGFEVIAFAAYSGFIERKGNMFG